MIGSERYRFENSPKCLKDYKPPSADSLRKANEYLEEYGVFDGHNDLPMTITYFGEMSNDLSKIDLYNEDKIGAETTIPWIKEGKLRKVFLWSYFYWPDIDMRRRVWVGSAMWWAPIRKPFLELNFGQFTGVAKRIIKMVFSGQWSKLIWFIE